MLLIRILWARRGGIKDTPNVFGLNDQKEEATISQGEARFVAVCGSVLVGGCESVVWTC